MKRTLSLHVGTIAGIQVSAGPAALISALLLWLLFSLAGTRFLRWRPEKAIAMGLAGVVLHFLAEFWHQLGHARAAEQTGYPMQGMHFTGPLAFSVYPENEGLLSAETHIQRALGGPIFSLLLAIFSGLIVLVLRPLGGSALVLAMLSFLDNLLVFSIGALLPLGFTDGSTLLQWWPARQSNRRVPLV